MCGGYGDFPAEIITLVYTLTNVYYTLSLSLFSKLVERRREECQRGPEVSRQLVHRH